MHITAQGCRLRNDLYCVEWDVKLYYTIPYIRISENNKLHVRWHLFQEFLFVYLSFLPDIESL